VRIGVEMIGTQSASRYRGIGRYCRNFAGALRARGEGAGHEFVFYAAGGLPTDMIPEGPNATLRRLRPDPHLRYTFGRLVWENPDGLDALVFTNPLELNPGNDIPARPPRGVGVPRLAAVVCDLVPWLFPEDYLRRWPGTLFARRYLWALERLRTYDQLFAISGATRDDLVGRLRVPAGKVVAVGTGGDDRGTPFEPGGGDDPADLAAVAGLGLDGPFVYSVAAADARKNLAGLIDAFALLPASVRASHRLAVTAGMTAGDARAGEFVRRAEARGVGGALVLTGPVDDRTLRALYRRCAVFAFPSLYEGFGLPVVEAMRCGAAVVSGDNSSLPEVAGCAALLVNAADPAAFAGALASVLTDAPLARSLREKGPGQARAFTWDAVAGKAIEALTSLHTAGDAHRVAARDGAAGGARPTGKPRVALFSPLPPTRSGVATYAGALVEALGDRYAVDLFHDPRESPFARFRPGGAGCFDYRVFARVDRARPYRAIVYQMGNSPAHAFVYEGLLKRPGVVVLHDPSLVFFHYERSVQSGGGRDAFRRVLKATHPDRAADWGPLLEGWSESPGAMARGLVGLGLDMNRVVVGLASAVVVHSHEALGRLDPRAVAKSFVMPLGAEPLARPAGRGATRARLGLGADALVVGAFGIVHPSKLIAEAIDAFAAVARAVPGSVFLVVGQEADDGEARGRAAALGLGDRVRFVGRPGDEEFLALVAATDLGVALRRPPTHGESSAALLDLMRSGVPAVVTDTGSFSEFPDGVVRKVRWDDGGGGGASGVEALARALLDLAADPAGRAALGRAGLDHVRAHHAWPRVAERYAEVIDWSTRPPQDGAGRPYPDRAFSTAR